MRTGTPGNNTKEARAAKTVWNLKFDVPELFSRTRSHNLDKTARNEINIEQDGGHRDSGMTGSR